MIYDWRYANGGNLKIYFKSLLSLPYHTRPSEFCLSSKRPPLHHSCLQIDNDTI